MVYILDAISLEYHFLFQTSIIPLNILPLGYNWEYTKKFLFDQRIYTSLEEI